jgi:hypothetical protein
MNKRGEWFSWTTHKIETTGSVGRWSCFNLTRLRKESKQGRKVMHVAAQFVIQMIPFQVDPMMPLSTGWTSQRSHLCLVCSSWIRSFPRKNERSGIFLPGLGPLARVTCFKLEEHSRLHDSIWHDSIWQTFGGADGFSWIVRGYHNSNFAGGFVLMMMQNCKSPTVVVNRRKRWCHCMRANIKMRSKATSCGLCSHEWKYDRKQGTIVRYQPGRNTGTH